MMGLNGIFAVIAAIGGIIFVVVVVGTVLFGEKINGGHKLTFPLHSGGGAARRRNTAAMGRSSFPARSSWSRSSSSASSSTTSSTGNTCRSCGCSGERHWSMQQSDNMRATAAMAGLAPQAQDRRHDRRERAAGSRSRAGRTCLVAGAGTGARHSRRSGAAGAFNHYYDRDLDRLMQRTRDRPFASGAFAGKPVVAGRRSSWLLAASLGLAALTRRSLAAAYVFLGAFTYGIVYTVWLKRRSTWNIVVGGLAGSFAVLAGAAAVDPSPQVVPAVLAAGAVSVDAAAFLEPGGRQGSGLCPGRHPDVAGRGAGLGLDHGHSRPFGRARADIAGAAAGSARGCSTALGAATGGGYFVCEERQALPRIRRTPRRWGTSSPRCCNSALLVAGALLSSAVGHWS